MANATAQRWLAEIDKRLNARDFIGASDALDNAEKDWAQTQSDPNPSFEIRSVNIQNALQVSQGREISRLDPKADVVNTFIKYARDAIASNRLTEALQNVNFALAVAPNYGAAKVLALQIKKQTQPCRFPERRRGRRSRNTRNLPLTRPMSRDNEPPIGRCWTIRGWILLLPHKRAIPSASWSTSWSLKRRPATAQQIAESNQLVRQANAVQQQGTPEAYQQALDLSETGFGDQSRQS